MEADRDGKYIQFAGAKYCNDEENDEIFKIEFKYRCKNTFEAELADIMIRVMDLASFKNINLEEIIKAVMRNNSLREHKHGKKY
jgi:NTP pyrophosphatase (non-canonical NTP hydrolase)